MPRLVITRGPNTEVEYPLNRDDILLGRDPRCNVLISHREVSGQHARITRIGSQTFIEDLGSRNGTFLNGKKVQRHLINDGDEITIGRTTFRFDAVSPHETLATKRTDPGTLTIEVDAMRDVFSITGSGRSHSPRQMDHVLRLLCDVSRTIGTLAGIKTTLDEIATTLVEVFPQCGRVMILLTSDGVSLEPVVVKWRDEPDLPTSHYSETVVRKASSERRAILTMDALSDDRFSSSKSIVDLRLRSLMCAPIVHRDRVLGVVELDTLDSTKMFTEEDLNLLTGVVAQLAFAVANAQLYDELRGLVSSAVSTLTTTLRLKSPQASAHCERVARYAIMMARRAEFSQLDIETLRLAALLHDIGLLALPDHLLKTDTDATIESTLHGGRALAPDDVALVQSHVERGAEILSPVKPLAGVVNLVLCHHEHFDGGGYPRGLAGDEIPIGARILSVADAFDAMTAEGYYQREYRASEALERLRAEAGKQFDPEMVRLFEQVWQARLRLEARRERGLEKKGGRKLEK